MRRALDMKIQRTLTLGGCITVQLVAIQFYCFRFNKHIFLFVVKFN